jgi:hypothetical protein
VRRMRIEGKLSRMQETTRGNRTIKRARRTPAAWVEEVSRWRASGQTSEQYANEHGLHPGTLAAWGSKARKLLTKTGDAVGPSVAVKFLPVRVAGAAPARTRPVRAALEIVLLNGRRIRVSGEFESEAVTRLVEIADGGTGC